MFAPRSFRFLCLLAFALLIGPASAQAQQYPWPLQPFDATHRITGTFSEYRDTGSAPHFHNGVDIPQLDGTPVYAVASGTVQSLDPNGSNAFVRVGRYAYVHIRPSPTLSVGDPVVAGETVLGTILPGLGHVHFTDGFVGSERQPLREGGGLTPFEDPWPPTILDVEFLFDATRQRLDPGELAGPVEIRFRVRERNAPDGTSEAGFNNGAYTVGYKVLSADRQTVVHSPTADGVQFRFDTKPSNSFVHNVFDQTRSSTTSHVYLPTNDLTRANAWDTGELEDGDYTVMVFAGDTRGNADTVYTDVHVTKRDLLPPPQTLLLAVTQDEGATPRFVWTGGAANDLAGFRLFRAPDARSWEIMYDESTLDASTTSYTADTPPTSSTYYYLAAADDATPPNIGLQSDAYGFAPDPAGRRILIVDGFDRVGPSGSWLEPWHDFAADHGRAVASNGFGFETVANELVENSRVNLSDYDAVIWLTGDESTADEAFSNAEQSRVRAYLDAGGQLFVSGSEIAWDLGNRGSSSDQAFLRNYLKVNYAGDDANNLSVTGSADGIFNNLSFRYGTTPYPEDFPDYYTPEGDAQAALLYGNNRIAGVTYEGTFGNGTDPGRLVVLGFPFETITGETTQHDVMARVLSFFFPGPVATENEPTTLPLALHPNYPNPFRRTTTISFSLPQPMQARLVVYDLLGRRIAVLADGSHIAGTHQIRWIPQDLAAGTYFLQLETEIATKTQALTVHR